MLKYKTRRNADPKGKAKIFFTSHPDDKEICLEKISADILQEADAAIWYDDDPWRAVSDDDEYFEALADMQLAVVAVTDKLLSTGCRATSDDIPFIFDKRIPVLPIVIGNVDLKKYEKIFLSLQYLDRAERDSTAISYREKLKKYLSANVTSDELAEKIRASFDAYIFLSYRKKDRKYAKELMHLIHQNDFCRDVAIWYDEYLTPGENFNDSIVAAFEKSNLFVMAITPNLVNEINYILTTEYPMASKSNKPIIPIEMVPTDKDELKKQYTGMPLCFDKKDTDKISEELKRTLGDALKHIAISEDSEDIEHLFFIGLAYLSGIDVEKDPDRAVKLIKKAGYKYLPQAIEKLANMYYTGDGVERDIKEAIYWKSMLSQAYYRNRDKYPKNDWIRLSRESKEEIARMYESSGEYENAIRTYTKDLKIGLPKVFRYVKISKLYIKLKDAKSALKFAKKAVSKAIYKEYKHFAALNLSEVYLALGMFSPAEKLLLKTTQKFTAESFYYKDEYVYHNVAVSHEHLASVYTYLGRYENALEEIMMAQQLRKMITEESENELISLGIHDSKIQHGAILNSLSRHSEAESVLRALKDDTASLLFGEPSVLLADLVLRHKTEFIKTLISLGKLTEASEIVESLNRENAVKDKPYINTYYIALLAYHAGLYDAAYSLLSDCDSASFSAFTFTEKLFVLQFEALLTELKELLGIEDTKEGKLSEAIRAISDTQISEREYLGCLEKKATVSIPFPLLKLIFDALMRSAKVRDAEKIAALMENLDKESSISSKATLAFKNRDFSTAAALSRAVSSSITNVARALKFRFAAISGAIKANELNHAKEDALWAHAEAKRLYMAEPSRLSRTLLYASYVFVLKTSLLLGDFDGAEKIFTEQSLIPDESQTDTEQLFFVNHKRLFIYSLLISFAPEEAKKQKYENSHHTLRHKVQIDYLKRIENLLENKRFSAAAKLEKRAIATASALKKSRGDAYSYDILWDTYVRIGKSECYATRYDRGRDFMLESVKVRAEQTSRYGSHEDYYRLAVAALAAEERLWHDKQSLRRKQLDTAVGAIKKAISLNPQEEYSELLGTIYSNYASFFVQNRNPDAAVKYYQDAINILIKINTKAAHRQLFLCYYHLGEISKALKAQYFPIAYTLYNEYKDDVKGYGTLKVLEYAILNNL